MFVTILFGILNRRTHRFLFVRAGHESPIFFNGRGSAKRLPRAKGQALGIFETVALEEQSVELTANSILLLYSDGLTDATDCRNERFGLKGIRPALDQMTASTAELVCDGLINAVTRHQGDCVQYDDMTVIVVRAA